MPSVSIGNNYFPSDDSELNIDFSLLSVTVAHFRPA